MGLSAAEQREIDGEIARNIALAASMRPIRRPKAPDVKARPLTRYWTKTKRPPKRPPGSKCRNCGKPVPHSTPVDKLFCWRSGFLRVRAKKQWQRRSKSERDYITNALKAGYIRGRINYRINQLRMWLEPRTLRVMGDKDLEEIVLAYRKSGYGRFRPWLQRRYPIREEYRKTLHTGSYL